VHSQGEVVVEVGVCASSELLDELGSAGLDRGGLPLSGPDRCDHGAQTEVSGEGRASGPEAQPQLASTQRRIDCPPTPLPDERDLEVALAQEIAERLGPEGLGT